MRHLQEDSSYGFTLIEIIGVLAVMSILAATIAPSAIQMITNSKQTSEDQALAAIADAMRLYVQTNKKVPAEVAANAITAVGSTTSVDAWDKAIGTIMNVPATKVSTNTINKKRIYLYPADFITASAPNPLPYDQQAELTDLNTGNGMLVTSKPDPRVMVISNMNSSVTLATASGQLATADFDAIWNQTAIPTAYAELTEGDKLKIARINMTDLFNAVTLSNSFSTDTYQAAIQVDGLPTTPYTWSRSSTTRNPITPYLISGSRLELLYTDVNPVSYTAPVTPITSFTTYDSNIVQSSSQHSFYLAGASSPAMWGSTQPANSGANNSGSNNNNNNNNTGTGVASVTNSNGNFNQWSPSSSCATTNTYDLAIDNSANNYKYWLYYGDSNGNIVAPISNNNSTNCNKKGQENKIDKGDNTCNFTIQECAMVVVVPEFKAQNNNTTTANPAPSLLLFYMPSQNTTKTLP